MKNELPSVALTTRFPALCEHHGSHRLAVKLVAVGRRSGVPGLPGSEDWTAWDADEIRAAIEYLQRVVRSLVVAILALVVLADGRVALVVGNSTYNRAGRPRYPCTRTVAACNEIAWKPSGGIVVEQRTRAFRVGAGTTRSSSVNPMVHSTNWMLGARPAGGCSAPTQLLVDRAQQIGMVSVHDRLHNGGDITEYYEVKHGQGD